MPSRKPIAAPLAPDATGSALALLRVLAGEEMLAAAMPILRERMALTPEKLALLLLRVLNPAELIQQGEEATLRGVRNETLKKHKDDRLLTPLLGGVLRPVNIK